MTVYLPGEKVLGADIPETEAVELAESGTTLTADGPLVPAGRVMSRSVNQASPGPGPPGWG